MPQIKNNKITKYTILTPKKSIPQRVKDILGSLISQQYGTGGIGAAANYQQRIVTVTPGQPIQISRDFLAIAVDGYSRNPIFYRGCRLIIDSASDINIDVVKRNSVPDPDDPGATKTVWQDADDEHPMNKILEWPNDDINWHDFQETWLLHLILTGNAFVLKVKPNNMLQILRPDKVKVYPNDTGGVDHYEYIPNEQTQDTIKYNADQILHSTLIDPVNNMDGVSPAEAVAESVALNNIARDWNKSKLENTVGLGGVFFGEAPLTENQQEEIEENVLQHAGPSSAGRYALLDGVRDFQELSGTPKDMDWSTVMDLSAHEICMGLGIPKELLFGQATYENQDQAIRQVYTRTILPLLGKIIDGLNHFLAPDYGTDVKFELDLEAITILQDDLATKSAWIMELVKNRTITVNEGRDKMGWETRQDCDVFLEPTQLLTVNTEGGDAPTNPGGAAEPAVTPPAENPGVRSPPGNGNAPPAGPEPAAALMATIAEIKAKMSLS
jgi:HK97 family phage portal protein